MDIELEFVDGDLQVAFTGVADSKGGGIEYSGEALSRLEEWVKENRPRKVRLDFTGLSFIDGTTFHKIAGDIERLKERVPVVLAGPGPALDRLFDFIGAPSGWAWSPSVAAASRLRKSAEAVEEIFEIDLDRELLLLESEPPLPEYNPMAEPLAFRDGWGDGNPEVDEARAGTRLLEASLEEAPDGAGDLPAIDHEETLDRDEALDLAAVEELLEKEERPAALGGPPECEGDDPRRHPAPAAPGVPEGIPRQREGQIQERFIEVMRTEETLLQLVAELEAETAALASSRIPEFLRSDVQRERFVRTYAVVLELNRSIGAIPGEVLLRIRSALTSSVRHAPFAMFDLGQARSDEDPAARAISIASMAVCMAFRAKAPPERVSVLALAGLLYFLLFPIQEAPSTEEALSALVPKLHRKLLRLLKEAGGAEISQEEVLEDLRLLSLLMEFWMKIGPGPEGGAGPASAAIALARGEIAPQVPARLRRLFLRTFSALPPGTWVKLESGEIGVAVAPGSGNAGCPLVLSLLEGGERELRVRPPALVETGLDRGRRVRAVVGCPLAKCEAPRPVQKAGADGSEEKGMEWTALEPRPIDPAITRKEPHVKKR